MPGFIVFGLNRFISIFKGFIILDPTVSLMSRLRIKVVLWPRSVWLYFMYILLLECWMYEVSFDHWFSRLYSYYLQYDVWQVWHILKLNISRPMHWIFYTSDTTPRSLLKKCDFNQFRCSAPTLHLPSCAKFRSS